MRIACFQGPEAADTVQGNLTLLAKTAQRARSAGADLLITPELFLTGYAIGAAEVARLAEPQGGAALATVAAIAKATGIAIILGYPERADAAIFNAAIAFDATGQQIGHYRKTHLFGSLDRAQFSPGQTPSTLFELNGYRIGLLICYDVEFPENVRHLALLGADLVIVPTALMQPYDVIAKTIVPARACENQIFAAYVNRCGIEASFDYCGLSCVVGPDGQDLARAGRGQSLILADIDLAALHRSREHNTYLQDRRPEQYLGLTEQKASQ